MHIVSAGDYAVGHSRKGSMTAYLGSCVGVSLCDRKSGVGGLIHLLLPEPTGANQSWMPLSYASTGLPLFIQELEERGAEKKNLEACVAGGALVGPISEKDLSLDIGGRTTDAVERILHEENIPILKTETGGHLGRGLILNLQNWESDIALVGDPSASGYGEMPEKLGSDALDEMIRHVRPIPQVALKIIRMIQESSVSMEDVAKEIRQDQIIAASVLRLCNSSLFGLKTKVDSIDRALVVLGEKRLLQLTVSASVETFFTESSQGYSLCKGGLYQHAMGTAIIAEKLADFTGRAVPDLAYTGGLLHDIGKAALDQYVAPAYPLFYRATETGCHLVDLEKKTFGIAHTEVGTRLAAQWALTESLTEVIAHHHYPENAKHHPALTHIVYLADLLMSRYVIGQELEGLDTDLLPQRLHQLGLSKAQFPLLIDLIPRRVLGGSAFSQGL